VLLGAVLGLLYLVGGQSVQFSGSEGSVLLVREHADDGALTLAGIAAVKLLATGWSVTSGYRGGLVFPSVFMGVAMSVVLGEVASGLAGPGAMIGCIGGILTDRHDFPSLGAAL
jgi:H+/Cl- antiporter ClcA